jgi:hypothetical protein
MVMLVLHDMLLSEPCTAKQCLWCGVQAQVEAYAGMYSPQCDIL